MRGKASLVDDLHGILLLRVLSDAPVHLSYLKQMKQGTVAAISRGHQPGVFYGFSGEVLAVFLQRDLVWCCMPKTVVTRSVIAIEDFHGLVTDC